MANSITGVNDDIISASVLRGFMASITPLAAFTTDFSADAARKGDRVSILRDNTAIDGVQTKTSHGDYVIQDADSDSVEIVLGQPKYVSWSLDDTEVASSSVVNLEQFGDRKGNALGKAIFQDIASLITAANYGTAAFTGAASTFDGDDVVNIKTVCDQADWDENNRWLILDSTYYNALLKDGAIKDTSSYGGWEAIREGRVPMLNGFKVLSSNIIPANGENLVGFASNGYGIASAFRYLQPQEGADYFRAERLEDPAGFTLGLRDWYDKDAGVRKRVIESVYGKVLGLSAGIKRIVSA